MRFTCDECVDEMRKLGWMMNDAAEPIRDYLIANYCPTLDDGQALCEKDLADGYVKMLTVLVFHYFVDGALHVCQTGGVCDAWSQREYTCEECVQGLEWVEQYMEDPIQVAEYFPPMHYMAMEKFMIPQEICNSEPVCNGN